MGKPNVLFLFPVVLVLDLVDTTFRVAVPPVLAVALLPPLPAIVVDCLNILGALFFCDDDDDEDDDAALVALLFTDEGRIPGLASSQSSSHCSPSPPAAPPSSISAVGSFL